MKKLFYLLMFVLLLVACGDEKEVDQIETSTEQVESNEPTQGELDAKLKEEAIILDFVEANSDNVAVDTKVTITGEITTVFSNELGGTFTVTTTEGDGFGMYTVENYALAELVEGSTISIYGRYKGKDDLGMPTITATVIE